MRITPGPIWVAPVVSVWCREHEPGLRSGPGELSVFNAGKFAQIGLTDLGVTLKGNEDFLAAMLLRDNENLGLSVARLTDLLKGYNSQEVEDEAPAPPEPEVGPEKPEAPFWVVWNPLGRSPVVRHDSRESATREAERLAKANGSQRFYVLEARSVSVAGGVKTEVLEEDFSDPFQG